MEKPKMKAVQLGEYDAKMSYFPRCFLRLFHCRTIRRETRVVEQGRIMPHIIKPLLSVRTRLSRRLRHSKCEPVGVTAASARSSPR
jgi:hypothetical protein